MVEEGAHLGKERNIEGGWTEGGSERENEKERQIETETNAEIDCDRKKNIILRVNFSVFLCPVGPLP